MLLNIPLATIFLSDCFWAISDFFPKKVPFVINEPLGHNFNGPLHLEKLWNMDYKEKSVQLNLEWQYESSTVKNDIRNVNRTQIENYASLRFVFETYNHDGWGIFGLVKTTPGKRMAKKTNGHFFANGQIINLEF